MIYSDWSWFCHLVDLLKSRDITLPTNVRKVKAMVCAVVIYGCESWTIKKAECRRIDAFKPWCWRRLLRVPWTGRRLNQSIRKEINHEYSLEGLILKLKLNTLATWCKRANSLEKTLKVGEEEEKRRRGQQRMAGWMASLTKWTCFCEHEQTPGNNEGQGSLAWCSSLGSQSRTLLSGWMTTTISHLALVYLSFFPCNNNAQEKGCCED